MARRNTLQKEIILSTLCSLRNHPTASMLYDAIHRNHPSISRSTVYRVLGQMAEEGTVLRLGLAGSDDRYDGNTAPHSHIRCRACGRVDDLPRAEVGALGDSAGYLVESCAIEYTGLCPQCQNAAEEGLVPAKASL